MRLPLLYILGMGLLCVACSTGPSDGEPTQNGPAAGGEGGDHSGGAPATPPGSGGAMGGFGDVSGGSGGGGPASGGTTGDEPCELGDYDDDFDLSTPCIAWTTCEAGTYVLHAGTETMDRVCQSCPSGTFTAADNQDSCDNWRDCSAGAYVSQSGSATLDRQCMPCSSGTHSSSENSQTCALAGECAAGNYQTKEATSSSAVECESCPAGHYCAGGEAEPAPCPEGTWDGGNSASECQLHTDCSPGSYETGAPTTTLDRTCAECATETFSSMVNAASCTAWSTCVAGTEISVAPNAATDRGCAECVDSFSTADNVADCTPWTICDEEDGYTEDVAGTTTSDRSCGPDYPVVVTSASGEFDLSDDGSLLAHTCSQGNGWSGVCVTDVALRTSELVSVSPEGNVGGSNSQKPSISGDGRFVAFESISENLVPGDANGVSDIFVHDRTLGTKIRVSVDSAEAEADGPSYEPSISSDGRYVVFESWASNLIVGDDNSQPDVFLHDLSTGTTTRVSAYGNNPDISADGTHIAIGHWLWSHQINIQVGLIERSSGTSELVSQSTEGTLSTGGGDRPSVANLGAYVVFESNAINLVPGDGNGDMDIFLRDVSAGTTTRVSVTSSGSQVSGDSRFPSISADGSHIVFQSEASQLVGGDTNNQDDVFHYDVVSGDVTRVGLGVGGTQLSEAYWPVISRDGRFVAYRGASKIYVNAIP